MDETGRKFAERVGDIRTKFVDRLPARVQEIRTAVHAEERQDTSETQMRKVHRMLHDLAGSAAMLDMESVESSLRQALGVAERADSQNSSFDDDDRAVIDRALSIVVRIATGSASAPPRKVNK
ncbi:Hpt domain-containing protein [Palleronia pelagia]|uniref:Hpt domain-containing protein n=1 Tax=Palleronia pelagia TaxID=387096 RepID=UPI000B80B894